MDKPAHPMPDPIPDGIERRLDERAISGPPGGEAGSPDLRAELDRYDIAVVLRDAYEWSGYRYTNASDAIAAAKRGKR